MVIIIYLEVRKTDDPRVFKKEEYFVERNELIDAYTKNREEACKEYFSLVSALFLRNIGVAAVDEPELLDLFVPKMIMDMKSEGIYACVYIGDSGIVPRYEIRSVAE